MDVLILLAVLGVIALLTLGASATAVLVVACVVIPVLAVLGAVRGGPYDDESLKDLHRPDAQRDRRRWR